MERAEPVVRLHRLDVGPLPGRVLVEATDWDLRPGAVAAVVGPIGSGKSSLLRTLGLLQPPLAGVYEFDGQPVAEMRPAAKAAVRRRLGLALPDLPWVAEATVRDNLALPLKVQETQAAAIDRVVGDFLDWLGLGGRADAPAFGLSDGERRLLRIARAAVTRPDLLLADEPLAGLDRGAADRVRRLLLELARLGTAVVVTAAEAAATAGLATETWKLDERRLRPADAAALRLAG